MNKKILVVFVGVLAVVMLATLLVGTVMAGKGQTRVSFRFVLVGTYGPEGETLVHGKSTHMFNYPFVATGWPGSEDYPTPYLPLELEIDGQPIPPELLSYEAYFPRVIWSEKGGNIVLTVIETITIGDGVGGVAGTIVLNVKGNNYNTGNGVGSGDSFIGFGTGAYEGVKIQGRTPDGSVQVGEMEVIDPTTGEPILLPISKLERVGIVMGWPTP
jgi:hypothetical protein